MAAKRSVFKDKVCHYTGIVTKVVDGDTVVVDLDLGMKHCWQAQRVRMARYNTAELHSVDPTEVAKAKKAVAFFNTLVKVGDTILIFTNNDIMDNYGRVLAECWNDPKAPSLNQQMIDSGLGMPWDGKGKKPIPAITNAGV